MENTPCIKLATWYTFLARYGYGSRPLEPEGPSLCNLGSGDFLASDDGAESFMALYLKDESTFELEITKYNIDDFSAERKKEGYLCTLEGNYSRAETIWVNRLYIS